MKALLIIDVQNDYFEGGKMPLSGADVAANSISHLLSRFRAEGMPVVHIQHLAMAPTATFFLPNTLGAAIHQSVLPNADECVIVKHFPNSFRGTQLLEYLESKGVDELIICGMMTHMCVDATTRAAKDLGYVCTVIADACATKDLEILGKSVTAEQVQLSFLSALNYFYSNVLTSSEYLSL